MKFTFAADSKPLIAADHLLVLVHQEDLGPRKQLLAKLSKLLTKPLAELAVQLGKEASVGLLGGNATSLTAKGNRITVGVLPSKISRHATEACAESVRKLTAAAGLRNGGKNAVLLMLRDEGHSLASCNAVGRWPAGGTAFAACASASSSLRRTSMWLMRSGGDQTAPPPCCAASRSASTSCSAESERIGRPLYAPPLASAGGWM